MRRLAKLLLALGLGFALLPVIVMTWGEPSDKGTEIRVGLATGTAPSADVPDPTALRRCRDLGRAALDDTNCIAIWAETRRRFLGGDGVETESVRAPDDAPTTEPVYGDMAVAPSDGATDTGATSSISNR